MIKPSTSVATFNSRLYFKEQVEKSVNQTKAPSDLIVADQRAMFVDFLGCSEVKNRSSQQIR